MASLLPKAKPARKADFDPRLMHHLFTVIKTLGLLLITGFVLYTYVLPQVSIPRQFTLIQWLALMGGVILLYRIGSFIVRDWPQGGNVARLVAVLAFIFLIFKYPESAPREVRVAPARAIATQAASATSSYRLRGILITAGVPTVTAPFNSRTWPAFDLAPGEKSQPFAIPVGRRPVVDNAFVRVHCVYADREEGIIGDTAHPCSDGAMMYVYVENATSQYQHVPYALLGMGETANTSCTEASPCRLTYGPGGETEHVTIAYGQRVCFDPEFWDNLPRLGYTTSYMGRAPRTYTCTKAQAESGQCASYVADQFWFRPTDPQVELPPYWFREENGDRSCDRPPLAQAEYNEETEE